MLYEYQRNTIEGEHDIDAGSLDKRISDADLPASIVSCHNAVCAVSFSEPLSEGDKAVLDGLVVTEKASVISIFKNKKIEGVKTKTEEEEGKGIPYNDHRFSVTASAKSNWLALVVAKDSLSYPFSAPTGYENMYAFQSANDVLGFFSASMAFLTYWESSHEQLVIAINACTTIEQLNAVVDDRSYPPA